MNNEPVAWMYNYENFPDSFVVCRARKSDQDIPLYTQQRPHNTVLVPCDKLAEMQAEIETLKAHSVKELDEQFKKGFEAGKEEGWKAHKFHHPVKELTDEEIRHIQAQCHLKDVGYDGFIMRFARAILRKASEK